MFNFAPTTIGGNLLDTMIGQHKQFSFPFSEKEITLFGKEKRFIYKIEEWWEICQVHDCTRVTMKMH